MKYDVFISYSRKDFDEVSSILEFLKTSIPGLTYWFDIDGIESGDEFEDKIISAIDNSAYVLFALSENSISSGWTKDEVMYAKNTDKKVIPLLLKGAEMKGWFLFRFGRIDCIDTTNPLQMEKLFQNLSTWTGKEYVGDSQPIDNEESVVMCPCGSGKLFKDCHGKTDTVPVTSRQLPAVDEQTKVTTRKAIYDQTIEQEMSIILKTLNAYKLTVACITANVQSDGVMYKITPGSGTKPSAIANIHREIAFALGVNKVDVTAHADGVALIVTKETIWKVGDYYNVDGKEGIVFQVDGTGKHGKIVSLDETKLQWFTGVGSGSRKIVWCPTDAVFKEQPVAVDLVDGMLNLKAVMENYLWREEYPAFAWCADHGDGWYLPAIYELSQLISVKNKLKRKINGEYWSSTEGQDGNVLCFDAAIADSKSFHYTTLLNVCAVSKF